MVNEPTFIVIDLFCGAGGTTTGFAMTKDGIAKVIACVNHDAKAIESHWKNHPEVKHFEEDIRTLDLTELAMCAKNWQDQYPDAQLVLWASLECTNFSKAKGGQPRDADSRTLADHLHRYVNILQPDYVMIENVVEFMSWGPLNGHGKPVSRKNGSDWMRWCREMCDHGYVNDWKELNSADFGAYTSRNRLFGIFARPHLSITFPEPTHSKKPGKGMFEGLQKWMPVKHVLDFSDEGISIFTRKKPLSDKTLERIYAGLIKYIAKGDTAFISKYFSGRPKGKVNSIDDPCPTNTTFGGNSLVQAEFLSHYYGNGFNTGMSEPCPTVTTKERSALVKPVPFIMPTNFDNTPKSIEEPAPTITASRKHHYIVNPSHGGHCTSTDAPCPVIVARQDKAPLYVVQCDNGQVAIEVYESDSEIMIMIKQFMAVYSLVDIKMRMLRVHELLKIQGFPNEYVLCGNQSDQKKFIGNSVVPLVVKVWAEALAERLIENNKIKVA